ncbi:MAG: ceramidase domain-containing protein [Elusimicrobia bacterium]|nr:ceramidase domain-containing protein [Elusimicrobiota bacterium]
MCWPDCFCEAPRDAFIRQPANTWSNLATVGLGLAIVWAARRERDPKSAATYGALVAFLGAGSFFFHASLTWVGEGIDVLGMYLVVGYLALLGLKRAGRLPGPFGLWFAGLAAVSAVVLVSEPGHALRRPLFGGLLAALLAVECMPSERRPDRRWLAGALGLFLVAFTIWSLDARRVLCAPESWLQGHAVWHLLTAGALGLLFAYYRSEQGGAYERDRDRIPGDRGLDRSEGGAVV